MNTVNTSTMPPVAAGPSNGVARLRASDAVEPASIPEAPASPPGKPRLPVSPPNSRAITPCPAVSAAHFAITVDS